MNSTLSYIKIHSQGWHNIARRLISIVVPVGQEKRASSSKSHINHWKHLNNYIEITHTTTIIIKTCLLSQCFKACLKLPVSEWLECIRLPVSKCSSSIKKIIFAQNSLKKSIELPLNFTYSVKIFSEIFGHIPVNNPMYPTQLYLRYTILYFQPSWPLKVGRFEMSSHGEVKNKTN